MRFPFVSYQLAVLHINTHESISADRNKSMVLIIAFHIETGVESNLSRMLPREPIMVSPGCYWLFRSFVSFRMVGVDVTMLSSFE